MKWILFLLFSVNAFAATTTHKTDKLKLGRDTGEDIYIFADTGAVNLPYLFFDFSEGVWKKSDDGVTSTPLGGESAITTEGDLIVGNASGEDSRLAIGTNGQILSSNGTTAEWIDFVPSPTTTLGDLIFRGAATDERLAIGTQDQILTVELGQPLWKDAPVSTTVSVKGDIQTHDGTSNTSLGVGNDGDFLVADSGEITGLKWSDQLQGVLNPVGDWENCTTTATWTNITLTCKSRQVGDTKEYYFTIVNTGSNTGNLRINLPAGEVIDTTKTDAVGNYRIDGAGASTFDAFGRIVSFPVYIDNTTVGILILDDASGSSHVWSTLTDTFPRNDAVGDIHVVNFKVPIVGLSSGTDAVVRNRQQTDVLADSNGSGTINVGNPIPFTIEKRDSLSEWNTDTFTASADKNINLSGSILANASVSGLLQAYVDRGSGYLVEKTCGYFPARTNTVFNCNVKLSQGDSMQLRFNNTIQLASSASIHNIEIKEIPDNIVVAGTFGTYREKYLSADINTNITGISDLEFNDLIAGKSYRVCIKIKAQSTANDNYDIFAAHDGSSLMAVTGSGTSANLVKTNQECTVFVATTNILSFNSTSVSATTSIKGTNNNQGTYVSLEEYKKEIQ